MAGRWFSFWDGAPIFQVQCHVSFNKGCHIFVFNVEDGGAGWAAGFLWIAMYNSQSWATGTWRWWETPSSHQEFQVPKMEGILTKTQRTQTFWEPLGKTIFKGNPKSLNFYFLVIWWGKEGIRTPICSLYGIRPAYGYGSLKPTPKIGGLIRFRKPSILGTWNSCWIFSSSPFLKGADFQVEYSSNFRGIYIWEVLPNHPMFNRIFHYFHHPFWVFFPLFLETSILLGKTLVYIFDPMKFRSSPHKSRVPLNPGSPSRPLI